MCCRWSLRGWNGTRTGTDERERVFDGRAGAVRDLSSAVRRESSRGRARVLRGGAAGPRRAGFAAPVGGAVHRRKCRRGHGVFFALQPALPVLPERRHQSRGKRTGRDRGAAGGDFLRATGARRGDAGSRDAVAFRPSDFGGASHGESARADAARGLEQQRLRATGNDPRNRGRNRRVPARPEIYRRKKRGRVLGRAGLFFVRLGGARGDDRGKGRAGTARGWDLDAGRVGASFDFAGQAKRKHENPRLALENFRRQDNAVTDGAVYADVPRGGGQRAEPEADDLRVSIRGRLRAGPRDYALLCAGTRRGVGGVRAEI